MKPTSPRLASDLFGVIPPVRLLPTCRCLIRRQANWTSSCTTTTNGCCSVVLYVRLPGDDEVQNEAPRITINGVALTASEAHMMCLAVMSFAEIIDHLDLKDDS